jgi:hypothetical protein
MSLADNLEPGTPQQARNALPKQRVIISENNALT